MTTESNETIRDNFLRLLDSQIAEFEAQLERYKALRKFADEILPGHAIEPPKPPQSVNSENKSAQCSAYRRELNLPCPRTCVLCELGPCRFSWVAEVAAKVRSHLGQ